MTRRSITLALVAATVMAVAACSDGEVVLVPPDGSHSDEFGESIAVSPDGTIIVGSPGAEVTWEEYGVTTEGQDYGAVYVYNGGQSISGPAKRITASDGARAANFGISVAVSPDGDIIVGGRNAAYVYRRQSDRTYAEHRLHPPTDPGEYSLFGSSVAAMPDGSVLVGAPGAQGGRNPGPGHVHLFAPVGDGYTWVESLSASDYSTGYDNLGRVVAAAPDGTIVVSARRIGPDTAVEEGAVYLYVPAADGQRTEIQLRPSDGAPGRDFGSAVAVSEDGVIVVGAGPAEAPRGIGRGAIYIYSPKGDGGFAEQQILSPEADPSFGFSLAVGPNGTIVVGVSNAGSASELPGPGTGAVYSYQLGPSGYEERENHHAAHRSDYAGFGQTVIVGPDGRVFVSATRASDYRGTVHVID